MSIRRGHSASGWVANRAAAPRVLAGSASCGWVANRAAAPRVLADSASCEWVAARGGSPPCACGFHELWVGGQPGGIPSFACEFSLARAARPERPSFCLACTPHERVWRVLQPRSDGGSTHLCAQGLRLLGMDGSTHWCAQAFRLLGRDGGSKRLCARVNLGEVK